MFLQKLGADEQVRHLFDSHVQQEQQQGLELGRVCFASHEQYNVFLEAGPFEGQPTGRLRFDETLPAVGDWVAARRVDEAFALIEGVLPRRTKFSRTAAGSGVHEQVIATNIDVAMIVCGLDHDFNLRRIERYLVLVRESGADSLIVLNKADLCGAVGERVQEVKAIAEWPVVALNARADVSSLLPFVKGKTVALLGSSGAGKSTITNALVGEDQQDTGGVRGHDSRGRHTTTSRMLIPLPLGGALIDNPGMREIQLWASESSLNDVFAEIAGLAEHCHFADCSHSAEPGCAVLEALEQGQLDEARWQSYQKLNAELQYQHRLQDKQAMLAQKKMWKTLHKAIRHHLNYNHPKYKR